MPDIGNTPVLLWFVCQTASAHQSNDPDPDWIYAGTFERLTDDRVAEAFAMVREACGDKATGMRVLVFDNPECEGEPVFIARNPLPSNVFPDEGAPGHVYVPGIDPDYPPPDERPEPATLGETAAQDYIGTQPPPGDAPDDVRQLAAEEGELTEEAMLRKGNFIDLTREEHEVLKAFLARFGASRAKVVEEEAETQLERVALHLSRGMVWAIETAQAEGHGTQWWKSVAGRQHVAHLCAAFSATWFNYESVTS